MAYITRSGRCYQVRQGNSGRLLSRFCGSGAKKNAEEELGRLHRKNNPKSSNRGKSAKKRNEKRMRGKKR